MIHSFRTMMHPFWKNGILFFQSRFFIGLSQARRDDRGSGLAGWVRARKSHDHGFFAELRKPFSACCAAVSREARGISLISEEPILPAVKGEWAPFMPF